jgi:hypothetical protein
MRHNLGHAMTAPHANALPGPADASIQVFQGETMRTTRICTGFALAAFAAVCVIPSIAYCQSIGETSVPAMEPTAAPAKPGPSYEAFTAVRMQCETDVPTGKLNGDVCARAAAMLLGAEPPEVYRDLSLTQRTKIALRLLEKGVDTSNVAAVRAFDLYNNNEWINFTTADSFRAKELLDMMVKRSYPGAVLRIAQSKVSLVNVIASAAEKTEACQTAKKMLAEGKLDSDSASLANGILDSGYCRNLPEFQSQPK